MLRVVKSAVLSQCWFYVNSPFISAAAVSTRALMSQQICIEPRDVNVEQRDEAYP